MLDFFPLSEPRESQKLVLDEIQSRFNAGFKYVIVEAPVGSGKSAIAISVSRYFDQAHILTPRKALQDQYYDDFEQYVYIMKGKSAYPCTYKMSDPQKANIARKVRRGQVIALFKDTVTTKDGPCLPDNIYVRTMCTQYHPCPYTQALDSAVQHSIIVHNIHSYVFQNSVIGAFEDREILIVDEAHELESTIRGFMTKSFRIRGDLDLPKDKDKTSISDWIEFLDQDKFKPISETAKRDYDESLSILRKFGTTPFVHTKELQSFSHTNFTTFTFIPEFVNTAIPEFVFGGNKRILLMSGTIYDKDTYCKSIGISPEDTAFIRVNSEFPVKNRPIYAKEAYRVDTSFANWDNALEELPPKLSPIFEVFKDSKGLIHAPSYKAAEQLIRVINNPRLVTHSPDNFQEKLTEFYDSEDPLIFVSPVCQQGVDFKEDRAKFQVILRVPYPNTSDPLTSKKVREDFNWYNHQALVIFGQQLGRINRAPDDFGATVLIDSRFPAFIQKNRSKLPKWLLDAIIYK